MGVFAGDALPSLDVRSRAGEPTALGRFRGGPASGEAATAFASMAKTLASLLTGFNGLGGTGRLAGLLCPDDGFETGLAAPRAGAASHDWRASTDTAALTFEAGTVSTAFSP